jgi:hypothetical protein
MTQDEQRQMGDTEQQLVREFGAVLGEDRVRHGVRDVVQLYAAAPVRAYLPVLVLRQARQQLRQLSETAAG